MQNALVLKKTSAYKLKGCDIMTRLVHYHENGDQNCKGLVDISRII
jgi:hypothetical protein